MSGGGNVITVNDFANVWVEAERTLQNRVVDDQLKLDKVNVNLNLKRLNTKRSTALWSRYSLRLPKHRKCLSSKFLTLRVFLLLRTPPTNWWYKTNLAE